MKKIINIKFGILVLVILFLTINSLFALDANSINFCCEKTKSGVYCQNSIEQECDTSINPLTGASFRKTPTNCKATSFCKPGCCIDTQEGICMENTPQRVCEDSKGSWINDESCNVAQCNLGCCILGDQASFVTLTRCKKLSSLYGLVTNFKNNINDEATCIMTASLGDKGACVFEFENQLTCKFLSRAECTISKLGKNASTEPKFYKDYLCSADELATNCGPTKKTMCIQGKNEVYFMDSCGNPANIYDSSKANDPSYWKNVVAKSQSCFPEQSNSNSKSCGNCDFFKGSICSKGDASYGENHCKDINCYNTENGKDYKNGESWCVNQGKEVLTQGIDYVGSRHFRHVCINGKELIEPCADYRNEICLQTTLDFSNGEKFSEAACRPNRWRDCINQKTKDDCENLDQRDCYWTKGIYYDGIMSDENSGATTQTSQLFAASTTGKTGGFSGGITGNVILKSEKEGVEEKEGVCLPNFSPGLKFWAKGESEALCSQASATCQVIYEKNIKNLFDYECKENCDCLTEKWVQSRNRACISIGDCGAYYNFIGGYSSKGAEWKVNSKKQTFSEGIVSGLRPSVSTSGG